MRALLAFALAAVAVAGCLGVDRGVAGPETAACEAPHPCGHTGWPADLVGPLQLQVPAR